jgi:hypothetical protein
MDPLQVALHDAFVKTYPKLSATLKTLVDADQTKRRIVAAIRRRVPSSIVSLAAECEVDYLMATAKADKAEGK